VDHPIQGTIQRGIEINNARSGGWRQRSHDHTSASGQGVDADTHQMAKTTLHEISGNRVSDSLGDHEAHLSGTGKGVFQQVRHQQRPARASPASYDEGEVSAPRQAVGGAQHENPQARAGSRSQAVAALAATSGQDGAAGAGAHPQSESMGLVPTTVVRLVSTLAHD
jgi:hypothetical protein